MNLAARCPKCETAFRLRRRPEGRSFACKRCGSKIPTEHVVPENLMLKRIGPRKRPSRSKAAWIADLVGWMVVAVFVTLVTVGYGIMALSGAGMLNAVRPVYRYGVIPAGLVTGVALCVQKAATVYYRR